MITPKFLQLQFGRTFWSTIVTEIFERGAWYGFFTVAPLFLTGAIKEGALGLSYEQAGMILGIAPFFLYFVPLFSGTIGDRIGYKKMLLASFVVLSVSYFLCSKATGFSSFLCYFLLVALGAGMFKPMVTSTVAQVTRGDAEKSSVGFGIFYAVVNLGGFVGPIVSGFFRPAIQPDGSVVGSWSILFYLSSAYMALMFFWVLFSYKEPERQRGDPLGKKLREMVTDLKDLKLVMLLAIMVGYWTNYVQFFYTIPLWITEWVDSSFLARLPVLNHWASAGQMKAEMLINLNGLTIILTSIWICSRTAKFGILKTMNWGSLILCLAVASLTFTTPQITGLASLWLLLGLIIIFSMAEIMTNPKSNELMGKIAPPEKVGAYQGYMFLSVAAGFFSAGKLVGLYGHFADKTGMYRDALVSRFGANPETVKTLNLFDLGQMLQKNGVNLDTLNQQLWHDHRPYLFWLICAGIGIATVIALAIYRRFVPQLERND